MSTDLASKILSGDQRALAAALTLIENNDPRAQAVLKAIYSKTGKAHVIGVTGAAGTGKSSLIDRLTAHYRRLKKTVGILAVDPSSIFSTGALLGDRIRMRPHFADSGVFIRSFATRGAGGGVSAPIREAIHLLDAAGKDVIFVESIGVGQDELSIASLVHLVIVVMIPETGDEVQALKAGLAEIADIVVVNKADIAGADAMVQQLKALFSEFDILAASAINDAGTRTLIEVIENHRINARSNGRFEEKQISLCRDELLALVRQRVLAQLNQRIDDRVLAATAKRLAAHRGDPYREADKIAKRLGF